MSEQCKARVIPRNIFPRRESQCVRDAVEDGLCLQHLRQSRAPTKQTKAQRIAELEAEVKWTQKNLVELSRQRDVSEAALERVRERDLRLIEEWRSSDCTDISIAADELAAALKGEGK